ncbi:hypothetical protein B0H14DRAFT_2572859 [Mycena olivaceomarginata]|nr:hypothetical protein B0H14DRAFT_2572859 [Mycena olivaceomarginata]
MFPTQIFVQDKHVTGQITALKKYVTGQMAAMTGQITAIGDQMAGVEKQMATTEKQMLMELKWQEVNGLFKMIRLQSQTPKQNSQGSTCRGGLPNVNGLANRLANPAEFEFGWGDMYGDRLVLSAFGHLHPGFVDILSEKAYRSGGRGPAIGADEAEAVENNTRQQKPVQAAMPRNDGCATVGHNARTGRIGRVGLFFNKRVLRSKSKRGGIKEQLQTEKVLFLHEAGLRTLPPVKLALATA